MMGKGEYVFGTAEGHPADGSDVGSQTQLPLPVNPRLFPTASAMWVPGGREV